MSRHAFLVAAIFVPYFITMATLFAYIIRTGRERRADEQERGDEDERPGPATLPLAA